MTPIRMIRALRAHVGGLDRGAAIVEAALAIPLLLLVIMGSIEFGFAWEARSTSASGVRTGILRAATVGDRPETDMRILQSVIGEVGPENVGNIEWVIIFDAQGADKEAAIADCDNNPFSPGCVVYRTAFLNNLAATTNAQAFQDAQFDDGRGATIAGAYQCDTSRIDRGFCASGRSDNDQDIEIGVAVRYNHEWFTGIFPFDPPTFQDHSVTSTFLNDGRQISPTAVVVPSNVGQIANFAFNAGIDPSQPGQVWSVDQSRVDSTYNYLGPFSNETVTLTLDAPTQDHNEVCVTFTLYGIDSWDGEKVTFDLEGVAGEQVFQHSTSNPNNIKDGLGNNDTSMGSNTWTDQKVTIQHCAPHTGGPISMNFASSGLQAIDDESWAIDDVVVTVRNN